jgi:hypoxanthine phosphoribosyltransferase
LYHRHILIIEDILDTGLTLQKIVQSLEEINPKSVKIAVMFDKPLARLNELQADFIGRKIESKFIIGYGLDFDGFGRNLPDVYKEA